jgi:hypothetical protein
MNLITQNSSDSSIGWKIPSFSINGNGHLIVTFED